MILSNQKNTLNFIFSFFLFVGLSVFIGWIFNIHSLKTSFLSNSTLKFSASFCLMLIGTCFLLIYNTKKFPVVNYFGMLIIVFALLTLSQNIFNYRLIVAELFGLNQENSLIQISLFSLPSPLTSFCLLLFGVAIIGNKSINAQTKLLAQYALHFITLISFVAIMGFLFNVPQFYKLSFLSSIPPNGAFSFFILSITASFINQNLGITGLFSGSNIGNVMVKTLFPKILVSVILLAYIRILIHEKHMVSVEFGIALFATSFILVTFYFVSVTANSLNQIDLKKQIAENGLIQLNQNLEKIIEDRTNDLKLINVNLEKSRAYFVNIFNVNAAATFIYAIEKNNEKFLEINSGFERMLGYNRDEVIGKNAVDLKIISIEDFTSNLILLQQNGFLRDVETNLIAKDGKKITVLFSLNNFKKDNVDCILCSFVNISDRIEEELKLKSLSESLTKQNKQLESFSFIVSHNLRGSTSNLVSLLHFYKDQNDKEGQDFIISKVEQTVLNLSETLNNLLEVISIKSDGNLKKEEISFEEVFIKLKQTYQGEIMKYEANIFHDFSKAPTIVYFEPYLESIMQNLLSNTLKYSNPKAKPIVKFETFMHNSFVYMKISDNGLGIDLERNGHHLFGFNKVFHKHPEAKGIGLFITKAQIESMGGEISAESQVGKGTTFTIIFNNNNLNT